MLAELYLALSTSYSAPKPIKAVEPFKVVERKTKAATKPRKRKPKKAITPKAVTTPKATTAPKSEPATAPQQPKASTTLNVEATFYTAFCAEGCGGVTATGLDVSNTIYHGGRRIIAVDPNYIKLGSTGTLTLSTGQTYRVTAQDTGGAIKGARIDLLVASESEANRLGRQPAVLKLDEMGTK